MSQLMKNQPFLASLVRLQESMNHLLDPAWMDNDRRWMDVLPSDWVPSIDLKDEKSNYVIHADVPGVDPKNIEVTVEGGMLTIRGHRESHKKEKGNNYMHEERQTGSFYRAISLPEPVDSAKISAKTKNGVLEVIVPKKKNGEKHKIKVK